MFKNNYQNDFGQYCAIRAYHHLLSSSIDRVWIAVRPPHSGALLVECLTLLQARIGIFGRRDISLDVLCTCRQEVITLAGRTLF